MSNFEGGTSVQYAEKVAGDLNSAGDRASLSRGIAAAAGIFDQSNGAWSTAKQELTASVDLKQQGLEGFQLIGANDSNPNDPSIELRNGQQEVMVDATGRIYDSPGDSQQNNDQPLTPPNGLDNQYPQTSDQTAPPAYPGAPEIIAPPGGQQDVPYPGYQQDLPQIPQDGYFPPNQGDGPQMPFMPTIPPYYQSFAPGEGPSMVFPQGQLEFPSLQELLGLQPGFDMPPQIYGPGGAPYQPGDGYYPMPGGPMDQFQYGQDNGVPGPLNLLNQMNNPFPTYDQQYPSTNDDPPTNDYPPSSDYAPPTGDDNSDDSGDDSY